MLIVFCIILPLILKDSLGDENSLHYLIEQPNVRGNKVENEVHWTLDLNGSYIIESVRINETFKENKLFWINVKTSNAFKVCKQMFEDENGRVVIKCKESMVIGRQLTIITNFRNVEQNNYILSINICSRTMYPLIESYVSVDSSLDDDNNTIVNYENISCKSIARWTNYSWWILIDMKEDVFVESFTFSGNHSKQIKVKNVGNKYVRAQVTNRRIVEIIETETQCNRSSRFTFTCNKNGTSILVKGSPNKEIGYLLCKPLIFGYKGQEKLQRSRGKCDFKILENTDIKDPTEKKAVSNHVWIVTLAALSSLLIILCLVTFGLLRRKLRIWSTANGRNLIQFLQGNHSRNQFNENLLSKEEGLEREFLNLPNGLVRSSDIGRRPANLEKNRFRNIIPFDDNLVELEDNGSSYINASFIKGFDGTPRAYIATQGPKKNTLNDFWKLVWQFKVDVIVMLMQLVENKCEKYWPDCEQKEITFGEISVAIAEECQFADCVRRRLVVKKINENARSVVHMHFMAWKDKCAPNYCFPLLDFRGKVNSLQMYSKSPLLVHCSAGVGRTGTYIAVDCLIKRAEVASGISVFDCVKDLRHQRMNMVQTKNQYIFVQKAVSEAAMLPEIGTNCIEFIKNFGGHLNQNSRPNNSCDGEYIKTYEILMKITQIHREDLTESRKANRKLPGRNVANDGNLLQNVDTDFSNSKVIQCFKTSNAHILSQIPIPGSNFWQILLENESYQVLLLDDTENKYWPEDSPLVLDGLKIQLKSEDKTNKYWTIRNFSVIDENYANFQEQNYKEVTQYHVTKRLWPENSKVPSNKNEFQKILTELVNSKKRIFLQCLNGSSRCGLTAAAMLMIDMILLDEVVDPFLACRYVLATRPEAIYALEQYKYLYFLALDYIRDCGRYNFMNSNNLNVRDSCASRDFGIYHVLGEH